MQKISVLSDILPLIFLLKKKIKSFVEHVPIQNIFLNKLKIVAHNRN